MSSDASEENLDSHGIAGALGYAAPLHRFSFEAGLSRQCAKFRKRWKTLSACNAERSLARLPNRRRVAQFAKTSVNLFVMAVSSGRRSNAWRPIITTDSKMKR